MFCNYCGAPNPDDAAFCRACGRATANAAEAPPERPILESALLPVVSEPSAPPPVVGETPTGRRRSLALPVMIGAVAVAAVLIRAWMVYEQDRRETDERDARIAADAARSSGDAARSIFGEYASSTNAPEIATTPSTSTASLDFPPNTFDPDAQACDRLADHPLDPQRVGDGVKMNEIDVSQALPVCERVASRTPPNARYQYLYGRVLEAASRPQEALRQYTLAERAGYAMADFNLGISYQNGDGVTPSRNASAQFFNRAQAAGVKDARAAIGDLYLYEEPADYQSAKAWYESAIEREESQGYAGLAILYDLGLGVDQDRIKGAQLAGKAADLGNVNGMYWTGRHYLDGQGVDKDPYAGCQWFDRAARAGYIYAQLEIGRCFYNRIVGDGNHESAFFWLIRAARAGLPQAQELVGDMYDSGDGVAPDPAEAVAWYRKAADQGDLYGMMQLGVHLRLGKGVPWNEAEAMQWFAKAADQGYAAAQSSLAQGYLSGLGQAQGQGRQDYQLAAQWFDRAAQQGEGFAQLNLGVMYENGWGVPRDLNRANDLYAQAAQSSNAPAAKVGKEYHDALSSSIAQNQASQPASSVGKPSNAEAWVGLIVTVVAVGAIAEFLGGGSSGSSDRSSPATSSGGFDPGPTWDGGTGWQPSSPAPVAVDPPTRPDLYYPSNPTRPVNGDLTDPSIARR